MESPAGLNPADPSLDMAKADPAAQFPRFQLDAANLRWIRGRPLVLLVYLALVATFVACLWAAGYPAWRIAFLGGVVLSLAVVLGWITTSEQVRPHPSLLIASQALLLLGAVVTGGLRSPLLITPIFLLVIGVTIGGSRAAIGGLALVAAVILAAPYLGPLTGPPVPEPFEGIFTFAFVVASLAAVMDHVAALAGSLIASTRELLRTRERMAAEALSRTGELELLSSRLSHELKNPLGAIKALVQLSARSGSVEENRERLAVVEGEIDRMEGILRGYLTFAKPLERVHVASTCLEEVVDDVLDVLEARAAEAGVSLIRRGAARAPVDRHRIQEAILNLVANALEASKPGGTIQVALHERDGTAKVVVRDEGAGMTPHVLGRLGTAFFTTREDGNGLGVLLARRAFEQHGGTLEFESAPEKGTTAMGTLPLRHERGIDGSRASGG